MAEWISVKDHKPKEFVSVLGHMTDTRNGEKPCVFCGKKCCGDCKAGVKAWLLKEAKEDGKH